MSDKPSEKSHVGSDPKAAGEAVGKDDFGVHENDVIERNYASGETRRNDKGGSVKRSGIDSRTSGVGGNDSGPGSNSGGDIDVGGDALTGVANPNQKRVPQDGNAKTPPPLDPPVINRDPARAGTLDNESSTSAADVTNETQHDNNAFKGDLTADEASGNSSR